MSNKRIWATLDPFVESGDILGRKVANSGFLTSLLQADPFDEYHFFLSNSSTVAWLEGWLTAHFPALVQRGAFMLTLQQTLHRHLAHTRYHCFHLSDCLNRPVALARLRNACAAHIFPITSPTHSLSYERFMPGYLAHLWEGVSSRDAIIVTSRSAKAMMGSTFSRLRREYGLAPETDADGAGQAPLTGTPGFRQPRLEQIPLGVAPAQLPRPEERWDACPPENSDAPAILGKGDTAHSTGFMSVASSEPARAMRARLGLQQECLFLCLARISPASKMDILPALAALKRAEGLGLAPNSYALALAGWADEGDPLPEVLQQYAKSMGIKLVPVLRPTTEECRALYAAADIFLSPSDNIQETFGLTIAEAGASGLPVIASDFDGYRDIIAHEETGLLIPTLGFAQSAETSNLAGVWFDNQYHLKLAQQVAVNVPAMAKAMARLGTDKHLRQTMGQAARERIRALFTWDVVIQRHVELWNSLAEQPLSPEEEARLRAAEHPLRMDFAHDFKAHFTKVLDAATASTLVLQRTPMGEALYKGSIPPLRYAGFEYMLDEESLRRVLLAARKPTPATILIEAAARGMQDTTHPQVLQERAAFTLLWALKQDYLEVVD